MSEAARRELSARQVWAAPGGSHDRLIGIARTILPVAIGVLAAFLVMAPLTAGGEVSFVLDKNRVEVADERMRTQAARYSGQDANGRPFQLTAGSAVQRSSAEPVVQLKDLAAGLRLSDGPATLEADRGRYDMETERVMLDGPIAFRAADGYVLDTSDATLDLQSRRMTSAGEVTGRTPQGAFSADRLRADLESRTVTLSGNARLRVTPGGTK